MIRNILKAKKRAEMINTILGQNRKRRGEMRKDILKKGLNLAVALIFGFNTIVQAQPLKIDTLRPVSLGNISAKRDVADSLKSSSAGKEFKENTIRELQALSSTLDIGESDLVTAILSSLISSQLITNIAEAGGRPTKEALKELKGYPMLEKIIARYEDKPRSSLPVDVFGDYDVNKLVDIISKISKQQNATIQRMTNVIFNCIEPTSFVERLAVVTERPDRDVAYILQHNAVLALVGTSYRVMHLEEEKTGNNITLTADRILNSEVVSKYAEELDIKVTLPENFQVDEGMYEAVIAHLDKAAEAVKQREYNYRGDVNGYYKEFLRTEAGEYEDFIQKNFGGRENIKYLITSGIGANEMYSHLMAALHNLSGKGPRWIVIDAPSDIKSLPADAASENTLFLEMSRSGSTQETLKLLQLTHKRFSRRVVYANKGPLRKQAEALRDGSDYPILVKDVAQDIGGRLMRRRTPLLLGPMYLLDKDRAAEYFRITDELDKKLDFTKGPDSLAVSLARFLYLCVVLGNRHNLALMYNNRQLLGPSAKEIRQLWMEGANKKPEYSLIMTTHEFPRDPHASMEGVFGQAASHIGFGIVARHSGADYDRETLITREDLQGLEEEAEQQHAGLSIDDIEYAFAAPNVEKCQKVMPTISIKMDSVTPQTASALTTLYEDMVVHYCAMTGQDPNSNPQVKLVREDTADLLRQMVQDKGSSKPSSAGQGHPQDLPRVSITDARKAYRYIGVSMGGNKLAVSVNDGNNNIIASKELRWDDDKRFNAGQIKQVSRANEVMDTLAGMIIELLEGNDIARNKIGIVAAGLAGPVDKEKGIFGSDFKTPNLPFKRYPFRKELIDRLSQKGVKVEVKIYNDAEAARNGERLSPQGQLRGIPGGIVIIGGGINISVDDESIKECGHNLYQIKDAEGNIHYTWSGDKTKGKHPIERGNTPGEIKRISGDMGEEYVGLGEKKFREKYPDYPFIEWGQGLRDFEDRLSGPNIRMRLKAAIEDAKQYQPPDILEYIAIEETANKLERKGELERALTPEALKGNKVAIEWIEKIAKEIGKALAAFISAYRKEDFAKHLVLVSGVSENLGKGVYKNKGDKVDIFMKSLRQSAKDELYSHFSMGRQPAQKAADGIVRSKMDYSRELVAYQPTDEEVLKAYQPATKPSSAGRIEGYEPWLMEEIEKRCDEAKRDIYSKANKSYKGKDIERSGDLWLTREISPQSYHGFRKAGKEQFIMEMLYYVAALAGENRQRALEILDTAFKQLVYVVTTPSDRQVYLWIDAGEALSNLKQRRADLFYRKRITPELKLERKTEELANTKVISRYSCTDSTLENDPDLRQGYYSVNNFYDTACSVFTLKQLRQLAALLKESEIPIEMHIDEKETIKMVEFPIAGWEPTSEWKVHATLFVKQYHRNEQFTIYKSTRNRKFTEFEFEREGFPKAKPGIKPSSAGETRDIIDISAKLIQTKSTLVSTEVSKLGTAVLDSTVSAYQKVIDQLKALKAKSPEAAVTVAEPLKVAEASLTIMTLSKDVAAESAKIGDIAGTIIINDAEIPANQKILLTLLDKENAYLKALEERLGCKIRLLSQFNAAYDITDNMIAISRTKIEGMHGLLIHRYVDVSTITEGAYLPLEQIIVLAKGLLVYSADRSESAGAAVAQIYRLLTKTPMRRKLLTAFLEPNGVFVLSLPSPVPVDERYYQDLHKQAMAALIAA